MSNAEKLHEETLTVVKTYQNQEKRLIELLMKNYQTNAFKELGYDNIHVYCTVGLGLSDAVTWTLRTIASKSLENPEIKSLIDENKMTITNAAQISRVITIENKENLLDLAQNLSKRELENEIKQIKPDPIPQERIRAITKELDVINLVLTERLKNDLHFLKNHYSKKAKSSLSFSETIALMSSEMRAKLDPLKIAERVLKRKVNLAKPGDAKSGTGMTQNNSKDVLDTHEEIASEIPDWVSEKIPDARVIPNSIKHRVTLRDNRQCTYQYQNGKRCSNIRYLNRHHIKSVAAGGVSSLDNLQIVCTFHHAFIHKQK